MTVKVTEAAREREAYRYDTSLLAKSIVNETQTPRDPATLSTSEDSALSAFAQLGALRLGGERCLISLFDRSLQHIVAEATAVSALGPSKPQGHLDGDPADGLWLCGTAIPRPQGVCEHVLHLPSPTVDDSTESTSSGDSSGSRKLGELPVSVIPDLAADSRFPGRLYCGRNRDSLGFYAGAPLRTRRGINIGVYCVFGREPKPSLDPTLTEVLREMAGTVMTYLEYRVSASSYRRSVRMVRGIGSLVEGQASMSNWWLDRNPGSFAADGNEGGLNSKQQALQRNIQEPPQVPFASQSAIPVMPRESATRSPSPPERLVQHAGGSDSGARQPSTKTTARTSSLVHDREDESITQLENLFSRAANLAREAVEVEGALFLDASVGSFGGLATQERLDSGTSSDTSKYSSAEESKSAHTGDDDSAMCKILGFSQTDNSSIDGDKAAVAHLKITEKFLRSILRRYPAGTIFNFTENGSLQSGDSEEDVFPEMAPPGGMPIIPPRKPKSRRSDRDVLTTAFAGARSVALVPLWDSHKERWYAGGFVWTRTPTRIFTIEGELSYLKALGMIIMSEVARINTFRSDTAKSDVLGSLSHELRSPLHGVVLGVELLHDTDLSSFQEDVINTVETCGRTLTETLDHLLDFSKINHFTKQVKKDRGKGSARGGFMNQQTTMEPGMMSLFTDVSLDLLVEEVVESVFAGHSFQQNSGSWKTTTRHINTSFNQAGTLRRLISLESPMDERNTQQWPGGMKQRPPVTIYLDIEHGVNWSFYAQPGAIRRVIMNLFGNALKYTTRGSIVLSLKHDPGSFGTKGRRRRVIFSISDSGKGISAEYLRNELFSPWTQEDSLNPGTGLGMSLVKQIIGSLKGEVGVESQVGRGTMVRVMLPLVPSRSSGDSDGATNISPGEADFQKNVNDLRGKSVCLVGFSDVPDADYPLLPTTSLPPNPKALMDYLCQNWLEMDVIPPEKAPSTPPSVYIATQESMDKLPATPSPDCPVLVLCPHALAAHELALSPPQTTYLTDFISQPPGPRKLAKALTNILARASEPRPEPQLGANSEGSPTPRPPALHSAISDPFNRMVGGLDAASAPKSPVVGVAELSGAEQATDSDQPPIALRPKGNEPADEQIEPRSRFLLVDDNVINLKILSSYMRKLDRGFDAAGNGLEALDLFRQNPERYCCIFMDLSMPVMDGLEATRSIRVYEQQLNLEPTLIVALTGLASADTQKDAFASGVNLFLTKPVPLKELSRILDTHKL